MLVMHHKALGGNESHVGGHNGQSRKRRSRRNRLRSRHLQQLEKDRARRSKSSGRHARTRRQFARKLQQRKKRRVRRRKNRYLRFFEDLQKSTLKQLPDEATVLQSTQPESKCASTWRSIYSVIDRENCQQEQQDSHWVAVSPQDSPVPKETKIEEDGLLLTIPVRINGHTLTALVDSGATRCYIKQECVAALGLDYQPSVSYLELADGTKLMSPGKCTGVHIYTGSVLAKVPLTVTKMLENVQLILGINWLEIFNPLIDWKNHQLWLQTSEGPVGVRGTLSNRQSDMGTIKVLASMGDDLNKDQLDQLKAASDVEYLPDPNFCHPTLPSPPPHFGLSETIDGTFNSIMSGTTFSSPGDSAADTVTSSKPVERVKVVQRIGGKRVVKITTKEKNQRVMVSMKAIKKAVKKGETAYLAVVRPDLSKIREKSIVASIGMTEGKKKQLSRQQGPKKQFDSVEEVRRKVLEKVRPACRAELHKIFKEYEDVFPEKLPKGKPAERDVEHEIRVEEDAKPQSRPPYKLSPAERDEVEAQIADLLAQGFIQPSCSPYGAPVLFVPKKDGRWRMCIDYRALNKQTVKDKYPLPRVDELLDRLGGNSYFTKLDLASGYHQIAMKDNSIERTAFRTHLGHYEFLVMPFGLTNAPATFQRLMNKIFRNELGDFILVFLDDILIYSKTLEDHYRHIRTALDRLREAKLYGRLHKCDWVQDKVEYLGFDVSAAGVEPSKEKVKAVATWPRPSSVRDVRAFLGLASFYRRFIRNFSRIARPLTDLTKDTASVETWTTEHETAFLKLKAALVNAPILRLPDFSKPFTVTTDASQVALGAVLEQDFGNGNQPVAYASKKLSPTEMRYSAYERELLGIVWALGQWRHYLEHQMFTVQTDHSSLRYLPDQPAVNRRIWKWTSIIQGYKMKIQHIPGAKNPADSLTRRAWLSDRADQEQVKGQEAEWSNKWRKMDLSSNEAIRAALEEMFAPKEDVQSEGKSDKVEENFSEPVAMVMVSRAAIELDEDLRTEIQTAVEADDEYKEILEELRQTDVSEVKTDGGTFKLRHQRLHYHPKKEEYKAGQYWKLVVPNNIEVKKKLLKELHSVPYAGHPGVQRTLIKIREAFFWKGMTRDVREYVEQCPICQTEKSDHRRQAGPLQPLQVPERKWQEIALDWVTNLPVSSKENDAIMTVVDRATKMAYFLPCKTTMTAYQAAKLYWNRIGTVHGMPAALISDRDPKFTGNFWDELWKQFGTELKMGSGYHPQSSGQAERYNQMLEQVLRVTIHTLQDESDWERILPTVQYVVNNTPNRHTGYTPFFLNYGYHPTTPTQMLSDNDTKLENVNSFVSRMKREFSLARKNLQNARDSMMKQEKGRRRPQEFSVGDQVLLSTVNLRFKNYPWKLQRRFIGPFTVIKKISTVAYELELPTHMKVHPVFHTSLLKLWQEGMWTEHIAEPTPELSQGEEEEPWETEKLLRWRKVKIHNRVQREFLVIWKDRPLDESQWVLESEFLDKEELESDIRRDKPIFVKT